MILQVQDVSKKFGGLQALLDVNFELAEGQIMGLIGPNSKPLPPSITITRISRDIWNRKASSGSTLPFLKK